LLRWHHGSFVKGGAAFLRLVAIAGPVLPGLFTALYIGRPSPYFLATGLTLAVAILACDGWIIARRHWITAGFALSTQIAFLIFVGTYTASGQSGSQSLGGQISLGRIPMRKISTSP
jgi:hypothetical protein